MSEYILSNKTLTFLLLKHIGMLCAALFSLTAIFTSYKIILTVNLKMCIYSEFEITNNYNVRIIFIYHNYLFIKKGV